VTWQQSVDKSYCLDNRLILAVEISFLDEFSGSMLETGLSLNRVTTVGEQMLEG
jgi:ethanolamine utilization microcompartment shell protein EutS